MNLRSASLLVALCAALATSLATRRQESPRALADAFVRAANQADRSSLEALVHPEVVSYMKHRHPRRWDEVVSAWTRTRFDPGYEVVVREASEVELYDSERAALVFGERLLFRYPVLPPSHFLIISTRNGLSTAEPGEAGQPGFGESKAIEATRAEGGRWYLTVPIVEMLPD